MNHIRCIFTAIKILFLLVVTAAPAVAQKILWQQRYGSRKTENAWCIIRTADKGYLVGSSTLNDTLPGYHG